MEYQEVLQSLAPCGLGCAKCFAFEDGQIGHHARALRQGLGNFEIYAMRFSAFVPELEDYPAFARVLDFLARPDCRGCRHDGCLWPGCGVFECYQEKGVDFCSQCDEFPCQKTNFDQHLQKRWIKMNERMKEIGPQAYCEESRDDPRYV